MKTLTYDTPKGPKPWGGGQRTSPEIIDRPQSPNEEQSLVSCGKSLLDTGYNSDVESASINRHMERMHIKEDTSLATPAKNKYQVKMDILLEDSFHFGPTSFTVTRPKAKSAYRWSPLQKLGGHHDVVLKKQTESMKWQPASASLQLYNSAAPGLDSMTILPENQSLGGGNETVCSSFLEMYESADEHCSWGDITIGDLYPGMVKSLSRLLQKASREAASNSSIKRYKYGYWNPKKTKLNTSTDRVRLSRPLKQKSSLTIREDDSRPGVSNSIYLGGRRRQSRGEAGPHKGFHTKKSSNVIINSFNYF